MCNLSIDKKILYISRNEYNYFLSKKNVVAVGLGYKCTGGFNTFKKCIKVFVTKKLHSKYISLNNLIPLTYKGIKTDVIESGSIVYSSLTKKVRPVIGGYSSASIKITDEAGSLACAVTDGKEIYLLSNNHVFADKNKNPIGTPILQPAIVDGGTLPKAVVAYLSKFVPIRFASIHSSPVNYVDCAIAKVSRPSIASSKIAYIGNVTGVTNPILNEIVEKSGRTTEYTIGKVSALGITAYVGVDPEKTLYKDQITTNKITNLGDSGCLLVNSKKEAVGLYFAQCNSASFYNPIYKVLSSLGVNIITNNN